MRKIRCPYCLKIVEPTEQRVKFTGKIKYICPIKECNRELPRDFIEKEDALRATVGLVGFTGHGKTVYLTSLFYLLKFLSRSNDWGDFSYLALDQHTLDTIYKHVSLFEKESQLPAGTPENFPEPALIQFNAIPSFEDSFISFYDTAGRVYEDVGKITDMGRFVAFSKVVLFIISIEDCKKTGGLADEMEKLLNIYINAAYDKLGVKLKKNQHLIVVLTKADVIEGLPEELKDFLNKGSYEWYRIENPNAKKGIPDSKLKDIKEKSKYIKSWLENNECGGFTKLAERNFKSVEYTIVSSLGSAPVGANLATRLQPEHPKRVLDPFLWVIEKTRPKGILEKIFGRLVCKYFI